MIFFVCAVSGSTGTAVFLHSFIYSISLPSWVMAVRHNMHQQSTSRSDQPARSGINPELMNMRAALADAPQRVHCRRAGSRRFHILHGKQRIPAHQQVVVYMS